MCKTSHHGNFAKELIHSALVESVLKVRFDEKEIVKLLILCHRQTDQTFHCIQRVCLNFRAQKCSKYKAVKQKTAGKITFNVEYSLLQLYRWT